MLRWILRRIIGFILPNLISNFLKSEKTSEKINKIKIQIKIVDKNLGDDIPLPKFNTDGSAALDLRTNIETSNTQSVLDGNIDLFIEASLKKGEK